MENIKIDIKNMELYYGDFHALKNVNLSLPEKQITAFIGPSGCGKTTLLRLIAGFQTASEGEIRISGMEITQIDSFEIPEPNE